MIGYFPDCPLILKIKLFSVLSLNPYSPNEFINDFYTEDTRLPTVQHSEHLEFLLR